MQNKLDLNLAITLCEVIDAGSVSAAAINLKKNISAVSSDLNKLRKHYGDTLFFRQGNGMMPTALSLELYKIYRPALNLFDEAENIKSNNLPNHIQKLRISTVPLIGLFLMDKFLDSPDFCNKTNWDLLSIYQDSNLRIERLRRKQIDIDIGTELPNDSSLISYPVFYSGMTMLCSKDHPRIKEPVTIELFQQESPLGFIYLEEKLGKEIPNVLHSSGELWVRSFRSSSIVSILLQIAKRDFATMMPSALAPWVCETFGLREVEYNFSVKQTTAYYAYIHRSEKNNPLLREAIDFLSELR